MKEMIMKEIQALTKSYNECKYQTQKESIRMRIIKLQKQLHND